MLILHPLALLHALLTIPFHGRRSAVLQTAVKGNNCPFRIERTHNLSSIHTINYGSRGSTEDRMPEPSYAGLRHVAFFLPGSGLLVRVSYAQRNFQTAMSVCTTSPHITSASANVVNYHHYNGNLSSAFATCACNMALLRSYCCDSFNVLLPTRLSDT